MHFHSPLFNIHSFFERQSRRLLLTSYFKELNNRTCSIMSYLIFLAHPAWPFKGPNLGERHPAFITISWYFGEARMTFETSSSVAHLPPSPIILFLHSLRSYPFPSVLILSSYGPGNEFHFNALPPMKLRGMIWPVEKESSFSEPALWCDRVIFSNFQLFKKTFQWEATRHKGITWGQRTIPGFTISSRNTTSANEEKSCSRDRSTRPWFYKSSNFFKDYNSKHSKYRSFVKLALVSHRPHYN